MYHVQIRVRATRDLTRVVDAFDIARAAVLNRKRVTRTATPEMNEADALLSFYVEDLADLEDRLRAEMLKTLDPLEFKIKIESVKERRSRH